MDVLFVGPTDLSHSLGVPGRFDDPGYLSAIGHVATVAEAAGKAAGILLYDAAAVAPHRELGFRFIGLGADGGFLGQRRAGHAAAVDREAADLLVGDAQLQRGRPLRRRPGLGDDHAGQDEGATDELDGRQRDREQDRRRARSSRSARPSR